MYYGHYTQQIIDPENLHVSCNYHQWNPLCLLEGGEENLQSYLIFIRVENKVKGNFWRNYVGTFWISSGEGLGRAVLGSQRSLKGIFSPSVTLTYFCKTLHSLSESRKWHNSPNHHNDFHVFCVFWPLQCPDMPLSGEIIVSAVISCLKTVTKHYINTRIQIFCIGSFCCLFYSYLNSVIFIIFIKLFIIVRLKLHFQLSSSAPVSMHVTSVFQRVIELMCKETVWHSSTNRILGNAIFLFIFSFF